MSIGDMPLSYTLAYYSEYMSRVDYAATAYQLRYTEYMITNNYTLTSTLTHI